MAIVSTSEHEGEKFLIMVKTKSNEIITIKCESELYYSKKVGQSINYEVFKGYFTGWTWYTNGVK